MVIILVKDEEVKFSLDYKSLRLTVNLFKKNTRIRECSMGLTFASFEQIDKSLA